MSSTRNLVFSGLCALALGWILMALYGYTRKPEENTMEMKTSASPRFGQSSVNSPSVRQGASDRLNFADYYLHVQKLRSTEDFEACLTGIIEDAVLSQTEKTARMGMLLSKWGELSPRQAIRKVLDEEDIRKLDTPGKLSPWLGCVFLGWAGKDPEGAAAFFAESNDPRIRKDSTIPLFLIDRWAADSPVNAWTWLVSQDENSFLYFDSYKNVIINNMSSHDTDRIPEFIAGMNEQDKERYASRLWERWFINHPDSPEQMGSLSGKSKEAALIGSIWGKTKGDLNALSRELSGYDHEEQQKILGELAPALLLGDKDKKEHNIHWLMENAPGIFLQDRARNSLSHWFHENREDAKEVLDRLPPGKEKEALMKVFNSSPIRYF